jgi:hypothetical protein
MGRSSSHAKRRFIEIRYFWFKEHLDGGFAKLDYLKSEDHPADPLLASVWSGAEFKHFVNLLPYCVVCADLYDNGYIFELQTVAIL